MKQPSMQPPTPPYDLDIKWFRPGTVIHVDTEPGPYWRSLEPTRHYVITDFVLGEVAHILHTLDGNVMAVDSYETRLTLHLEPGGGKCACRWRLVYDMNFKFALGSEHYILRDFISVWPGGRLTLELHRAYWDDVINPLGGEDEPLPTIGTSD